MRPPDLREHVIHEACHVWAYLIEEALPFRESIPDERFVLPSGTGNKNASEVLGAAYVAATLLTFYREMRSPAPGATRASYEEGRISWLEDYLDGCLGIAHRIDGWSGCGSHLLQRLVQVLGHDH